MKTYGWRVEESLRIRKIKFKKYCNTPVFSDTKNS